MDYLALGIRLCNFQSSDESDQWLASNPMAPKERYTE